MPTNRRAFFILAGKNEKHLWQLVVNLYIFYTTMVSKDRMRKKHECNMSFLPFFEPVAAIRAVKMAGILLLGGWLLSACQSDEGRDIRDYYFPLRSLEEGLVYAYEPVGDTVSGDVYWYYRTINTDSATYLTGAYYEDDFTPSQVVREEMVYNGMLLNSLFIFETDSTGKQQQIRAEVESASVFPFFVRDSNDVYLYKVSFSLPSQPHGTTTLIINRRFLGDTTVVFEGETYDALRFGLRGVVSVRDSIQGDIEPAFRGQEIYAHKLGLFSYHRNYGGAVLSYQLRERFPMSKLEAMSKERFDK